MADVTQPDVDEVEQEEPTGPAVGIPDVPVRVCGPVRTQELPSIDAAPRAVPLDSTTGAVKVLWAEPRRRRAVLLCTEDTYLGGSQAEAAPGSPGASLAFWPKNTSLTLLHAGELWMSLVTAPSARVTVIEELWTG